MRSMADFNIIRIRGGLVYTVLAGTGALEMNLMASFCNARSCLTADGLPDTKQPAAAAASSDLNVTSEIKKVARECDSDTDISRRGTV